MISSQRKIEALLSCGRRGPRSVLSATALVSMTRPFFVSFALALVLAAGCKMAPQEDTGSAAQPAAASTPTGKRGLVFQPATPGDVPALVRAESSRASAQGRRLLVYEGATWCEPCKRFHEAAGRGELDDAFPQLTLLEFDADRDRERLMASGYGSQYIPLVAIPAVDGRAAGQKAQGGVKGDGAVALLTQKLKDLLATAPP